MKVCTTCGVLLPLTEYYCTKGLRRATQCKTCAKQCCMKRHKERYKNDPAYRQKLRIQGNEWEKKHKDGVNFRVRLYQKTHPDKMKARYKARYYKRRYDPAWKMRLCQKSRIHIALHHAGIKKNSKTLELIGCSAFQLKEHIASKFKPGMSWENHGLRGWHVDHIKPLASFDFTDQKQIEAAFHYTNLQPLWWFENLSKGKKVA